MDKSTIVSVATLCGLFAFLLTLVRCSPERHVTRPTGVADAAPPPAAPPRSDIRPRSLVELEQAIQSGDQELMTWFQLAQRREAAGGPDNLPATWHAVLDRVPGAIAQRPDLASPWFIKGWTLDKLGQPEAALEAYRTAAPMLETRLQSGRGGGTSRAQLWLAWARHRLGDEDEARRLWSAWSESYENATTLDADSAYRLAVARSLLGWPDKALDALTIAAERGFTDAQWAAADDYLTAIRSSPRFEAALKKMREGAGRRESGE